VNYSLKLGRCQRGALLRLRELTGAHDPTICTVRNTRKLPPGRRLMKIQIQIGDRAYSVGYNCKSVEIQLITDRVVLESVVHPDRFTLKLPKWITRRPRLNSLAIWALQKIGLTPWIEYRSNTILGDVIRLDLDDPNFQTALLRSLDAMIGESRKYPEVILAGRRTWDRPIDLRGTHELFRLNAMGRPSIYDIPVVLVPYMDGILPLRLGDIQDAIRD